ncbi:MAG TPA: Holliday junction branch migration protein RuvA [Alteromonas australica]|jgi:holliday junction DNA helicase RuvA|uniref:Holliday junction branch migration complex subunit RuvA n=1 Tax=Alteromonas australica TaxID=589873 RepID=A0A075NUV4_9ALTE|nr:MULTISPECIES: Holliday junction branch migration protein RuvA [Alteromonas]MAF69649.1 Holliday junction branch migration protein RuvA [Alteromonas sp.]AIF98414.1 ATP-dependent DNA helicase RuvA [Alteromonas australica]AJP43400.1 ATP-dependent DNA helicase RuvA [Alteromonas australica]MAO30978.1 Holliday junction branch migration protein RuvA [Alteromonas sp.]MBU35050.1 Holliday junction branch migration protein RuvA [Alteromonas sp.]|tara:strand:+ start:1882 stop:2502 length:621 start_codon:yes stop_codon:yes gene_type:complete
MIGRIRGTLAEKQPPEILVDVAGVGYEIHMPMTSFYQLPAVGDEVVVYTHFVVREDAQLLFGFADKMERGLFRELIKANGVGPKLGLAILSGMSASQFLASVQNEDVSALVSLPGIGKKTAERLVVELKDRLAKFGKAQSIAVPPPSSDLLSANTFVEVNDTREEAQSALIALGYKPAQASKLVDSVYSEGMESEALIREALKAAI